MALVLLLMGVAVSATQQPPTPPPGEGSQTTPAPQAAAPTTIQPVSPLPAKPGRSKPAPPPPPSFPSTPKWSATVTAGPVTPPLVADGRILLALQSGVLASRQIDDGREIWSLKLAVDPPPIAPARVRQEAFAWSST